MWSDIASIVFVCVTANHLGLIRAVEDVLMIRLPVVGCVKCLTFWVTLIYCCHDMATYGTIEVLAISFLVSYAAIWLELAEGIVDVFYMMIYEKIVTTGTADTVAAGAGNDDTPSAVPDLQED